MFQETSLALGLCDYENLSIKAIYPILRQLFSHKLQGTDCSKQNVQNAITLIRLSYQTVIVDNKKRELCWEISPRFLGLEYKIIAMSAWNGDSVCSAKGERFSLRKQVIGESRETLRRK
jgi:hypothetical protein